MNKKKGIAFILLVFFLLSPLVLADDSFYTLDAMVIDINISSFLTIYKPKIDNRIDYVQVNLSFFPRKEIGQEVLADIISPEPLIYRDGILFKWIKPSKEKLDFSIRSRVKTTDRHTQIISKVDFPIQELPQETERFLEASEIIDINERISQLASELAAGEDDLVVVVDRIAEWVTTNIDYDLSTTTADAALPASWVLVNREGVCDELTSLFIAMLRSIGIPARFVSGVSYTNSDLFESNWGPHGWADVYFPGYGWVPYDVTYGEYGWIDPSHVVSAITEDAARPTAFYSWRAEQGVTLNIEKLDIKVDKAVPGDVRDKFVNIKTSTLYPSTGYGSYNIILAEVENIKSYYVSLDVFISQTEGLVLSGKSKKHLLLLPYEKKQVYWIVKVDENLNKEYVYTMPSAVYTIDNSIGETSFVASEDSPEFSLENIKETYNELVKEIVKTSSKELFLDCEPSKESYYVTEKPEISCTIKNQGNAFLKDISVCIKPDCKQESLGISQSSIVSFVLEPLSRGMKQLKVTAGNKEVSQQTVVGISIRDLPKISITDINAPSTVTYSEEYAVEFTITKDSLSNPENVVLRFGFDGQLRETDIDSLDKNLPYKINALGSELLHEENIFLIEVEYTDIEGEQLIVKKEVPIQLIDLSSWQKTKMFFKRLLIGMSGGLVL